MFVFLLQDLCLLYGTVAVVIQHDIYTELKALTHRILQVKNGPLALLYSVKSRTEATKYVFTILKISAGRIGPLESGQYVFYQPRSF